MRKIEFWKLKIKLGNWNFEEWFEDGVLKINNKIIITKIIKIK